MQSCWGRVTERGHRGDTQSRLQELGAGRLMVTENDMRMRNIADQILNRMAQAVPDIYIRIVCKLQGIQ